MLKKYNVICGHYGTGKTNFTINAAVNLAGQGKKVTVVDLDVVNPYFRSSDYIEQLESRGIKIICPYAANTTLDSPYLSAEIFSVFVDDRIVLFDVGGDDAGAYTLGMFSKKITDSNDYSGIFVINKYRNLIEEPSDALEIMREVEAAGKVPMTAVVNNSHLCSLTDEKTILDSLSYAQEFSRISGLPLIATTVPENIYDKLSDKVPNPYKTTVYVKLPWN